MCECVEGQGMGRVLKMTLDDKKYLHCDMYTELMSQYILQIVMIWTIGRRNSFPL